MLVDGVDIDCLCAVRRSAPVLGMDSIQPLTPKAASEVDTEHEEETLGIPGPSSLSAQQQRRRYISIGIALRYH